MPRKTCSDCGRSLPRRLFYRGHSYCKECSGIRKRAEQLALKEFWASEDATRVRTMLYAYGEMLHGHLERSNGRTCASDALEASFTNPKPEPVEDMASETRPGEFVKWLLGGQAGSWLQSAWWGQGRKAWSRG